MPALKSSAPSHLSIFVTNPENGHPVAQLPLYAEVAVPRIVPTAPVPEWFREPMRAALFAVDPTATDHVRDRVESETLKALGRVIDEASHQHLATHGQELFEFFERMFKEVLIITEQNHMADIPPTDLPRVIERAIRRVGDEMDLILKPEVENTGIIWADPLGVLTTDHVGYVSFDLKRLRPEVQIMLAEAIESRRANLETTVNLAIWVYPYGSTEKFEVLSQARFAFDAIVARIPMIWNTLPPALINLGPRALQNPSLTDWRLSPTSFAASPKTLVGEDGCETLVPASIALQEFVLRQVVRLSDIPPGFRVPPGSKVAYVDDYKVSWFSLGHSLGEILYSLPLAPGETVKLAVIDWSWDSLTKRDENTKLTEEILHQTHRDRTITETVKAGLKELQHGSSFMGGTANSLGATAGANLGVVGLGAALGHTWSLGGSTATSDGSRELVAENVQKLNDSFSQASSAQREINSTVVIQARQEEKESIQTRTFSNYNHSHTLTILYYEVLRHYRVTVEWVRRRPAILAKIPTRIDKFDAATLLNHRFLLEPALLDPNLRGAFEVLEKQEMISEHQTLHNIVTGDTPTPQFWEGDIRFSLFNFIIRTPDDEMLTPDKVVLWAIMRDGGAFELDYLYFGPHGNEKHEGYDNSPQNVNSGGRFNDGSGDQHLFVRPKPGPNNAPISIRWNDLAGFQFEKWGNDENWRIIRLGILGFDNHGAVIPLLDAPPSNTAEVYHELIGEEPSSQAVTFIRRPGPVPAPLPPIRSAEKSLAPEELHQVKKLFSHFESHKEYYNRVILLGTEPNSIAIAFENQDWMFGQKMDGHVDPTPLEVFGSYVAYPLAKQISTVDDTIVVDIASALNGNDAARRQWALDKLAEMNDADRQNVLERLPLASAKSERLITLPTRGVFAEGKLGHCNVSEEIDNTRFWKWEEHPIPFEAPGINPVTPIQPQPQQINATPTAFPQSLVNIVNPSPAPDPVGLSAALSLLGTPNIFRDMSGRAEVADLLKKLSDNTISIAEAANKAREIQAKYGVDLDKNQRESEARASEANAQVQTAKVNAEAKKTEADAKKAEIEADKMKLENAQKLLTPAEQKPVRAEVAKKWADPGQNQNLDILLYFRHGLSKQVLDGEFNVVIEGGPALEMDTVVTSGGAGKMTISKLAAGEYGVTITGRRTKLPNLQSATVTVPAIGNHPSFDVGLNRYIALQGLELSGNGKMKVEANMKRIVLNVNVLEKETTSQQEIDYSREQGVHLQAEVGFGAKLKDVELGSVKVGGTSIDVGTNSNKYTITLTWTFLTGGLEIA